MDENYTISAKEKTLVDAYFEEIENAVYGAETRFMEKGGILLKNAVKQILYSRTDEDSYLKRFFALCRRFRSCTKAKAVFRIHFSTIGEKAGDYFKVDFNMLKEQYHTANEKKVFENIMTRIVNFDPHPVTKAKKVTKKTIVKQLEKWLDPQETILTDMTSCEKEQLEKLLAYLQA